MGKHSAALTLIAASIYGGMDIEYRNANAKPKAAPQQAEKTKHDHERLLKAEQKRERKKLKRIANNRG